MKTIAILALAAALAASPATTDWNSATADNAGAPAGAFSTDHGRTGWFGRSWFDVDGNGCDTRNDILARDMTDVTFKKGSTCQVASGTLTDPYTGRTIEFTRGKETSQAVQIDHIIPLGYAYAHGASSWDAATRLAFANDPDNLLAVDGPSNAAKSDALLATSPTGTGSRYDPAGGRGWDVPNQAYRCTYAAKIDAVADKYHLELADADRQAVDARLDECGTHVVDTSVATKPAQMVVDSPAGATVGGGGLSESVLAGVSTLALVVLALLAGRQMWKHR